MPDLIEPGIYIGLDEDAYHADPALGSSALKALALDPTEYQYERLYGQEKDTTALMWGRLLHARVLEGRDAVEQRFAVEPNKDDYPKALVTLDDLRAYAKSLDLKGGKSKADFIELIRQHDRHNVQIWDEITEDFKEANKNKTLVSEKFRIEVERAASWMQSDHLISEVMKDGTFNGGLSEISIFHQNERGVRTKGRMDHLLAHTVIDVKSFRPMFRTSLDTSSIKAIQRERYDLQAAAYKRLLKLATDLLKAGKVFGAGKDELALLQKALNRKDLKWLWVLVKASGAPQPIVRELDLSSFIFRTALVDIESAIKRYADLGQEFGHENDWPPRHVVRVLGDTDFPAWLGQ